MMMMTTMCTDDDDDDDDDDDTAVDVDNGHVHMECRTYSRHLKGKNSYK